MPPAQHRRPVPPADHQHHRRAGTQPSRTHSPATAPSCCSTGVPGARSAPGSCARSGRGQGRRACPPFRTCPGTAGAVRGAPVGRRAEVAGPCVGHGHGVGPLGIPASSSSTRVLRQPGRQQQPAAPSPTRCIGSPPLHFPSENRARPSPDRVDRRVRDWRRPRAGPGSGRSPARPSLTGTPVRHGGHRADAPRPAASHPQMTGLLRGEAL
jgi:hypothetical protein